MSDGKSERVPKDTLCMKISVDVAIAFKNYCLKRYRTLWGMNREGEAALRQYLDRVNPGWDKKKG